MKTTDMDEKIDETFGEPRIVIKLPFKKILRSLFYAWICFSFVLVIINVGNMLNIVDKSDMFEFGGDMCIEYKDLFNDNFHIGCYPFMPWQQLAFSLSMFGFPFFIFIYGLNEKYHWIGVKNTDV